MIQTVSKEGTRSNCSMYLISALQLHFVLLIHYVRSLEFIYSS